jgi:dTDP-4-amino-4,6-dideoxygalactose transaminase
MGVQRAPSQSLAIYGGRPVRAAPMPSRRAFGVSERAMVNTAMDYYARRDMDPKYDGHFERQYTDAFVAMMGGGYADAVATGTAALYVAIAALALPKGSEVIVSPITDPGTLSAIVLNGLRPRLADCKPGTYNIGIDQFVERMTPSVSCAVIVHMAGAAAEVGPIVQHAHARGIKVVEDCSQAHGARICGRPVGTFGDIAAFSTMFGKAHITGSSGGLIYTHDEALFHLALAHSDRGDPRWKTNSSGRDPAGFMFPALNLHTDELSCAIGLSSLGRLPATISNRRRFVSKLAASVGDTSAVCRVYPFRDSDSPYFCPITVDCASIVCSKIEFATAIKAEGIDVNTHYRLVVSEWPFLRPYLADDFDTPNARAIRDQSFNVNLNEMYEEQEVRDTVEAIAKVEHYFAKEHRHG